MARYISAPVLWKGLELDGIIKNFAYNRAGTAVHPNARQDVIKALVDALNHLSAYSVRLFMSHVKQHQYAVARFATYSNYSSPFLICYRDDQGPAVKDIATRFIYKPEIDDPTYNCTASTHLSPEIDEFKNLTVSNKYCPQTKYTFDAIIEGKASYTGIITAYYFYYDTAASDDLIAFWDVCVQEEPIINHRRYKGGYENFASSDSAKNNSTITATPIEDLRSMLHDLRYYALPLAVSWCAESVDENAATDAFTTTSTSFENILDTGFSSRSTTSPGIFFDAYAAGVGTSTTANLRVYVYCSLDGGTGTIRIEGPNGSSDITTTTVSSHWYSTTITVNTDRDWDYTTDGDMNKIDILAKVTSGDTLYIRAIYGWLEY